MSARYLIRFDDVCPTLNWMIWREVENLLLESRIKPVLAVVPDNRDPGLRACEPNNRFWDEVRAWQARGWAIGLHGYQHLYVTGDGGLMGVNERSEFSGLPYADQWLKLRCALDVFQRERVSADLWVAPGHSFDAVTLQALRDLGMWRLSDGFSLYPHLDSNGTMWVPQQLWRFRRIPLGVWTVCFHVNHWSEADVAKFRLDLKRFAGSFTDWESVLSSFKNRRRNIVDSCFCSTYRVVMMCRRRAEVNSRLSL